MIVYNVGQVVSREAVCFQQDWVIKSRFQWSFNPFAWGSDGPINEISENRVPFRSKVPDHMGVSSCCPVVGFFLWYVRTCSVVALGQLMSDLLLCLGHQGFRAAKAPVCVAGVQ